VAPSVPVLGIGPVSSRGLRLVEQLRAITPGLTRVGSPRQLRHRLRPWLDTAWTIDDVLATLDRHPHTGARPHTPLTDTPTTGPGAIRNPAGWLTTWLGLDPLDLTVNNVNDMLYANQRGSAQAAVQRAAWGITSAV